MSNTAIRVENLGKQYKIGRSRVRHDTLRDSIAASLKRNNSGNDVRPTGDDTFWALKDVSFEIKPGEVVGIIGRNGAGKSTLLKILSRITEPTVGFVDIYGRVGTLLEVGTGFHPELTGRENIYLSGAILGMKRNEIARKFDEMVAFAEIDKFIDTPVKRYSSGMYVRLAFSVAAHLEPEILLVDEVLAVGDAAFQTKCLGKIGDVAREGRTVIFVSHNMEAIQRICPESLLLENGIVLGHGGTPNVIRTYFEKIQSFGETNPIFASGSILHTLRISVNEILDNRSVVWQDQTPLRISLSLESEEPMTCPRIDLVFYRLDALKLFALQSDRILIPPSDIRQRWNIAFEIESLGLTSQKIYFDVGVRESLHSAYSVLWPRACEVILETGGRGGDVTNDSLLLPRAQVIAEELGLT